MVVSELALEAWSAEHAPACTQRKEVKEQLVPQAQIIVTYKIMRPQLWGLIYLSISHW